MKRLWGALGLVLTLSVIMPSNAAAQTDPPGTVRKPGVTVRQNFPNPFNPETSIPFTVGDSPCTDPNKQYRVSVSIFNTLSQPVAVPIVKGGEAGGQPLRNLRLRCGDYVAFWDGKVQRTGREAPSGAYMYKVEVDGVSVVKTMFIGK